MSEAIIDQRKAVRPIVDVFEAACRWRDADASVPDAKWKSLEELGQAIDKARAAMMQMALDAYLSTLIPS